MPGAARPVLKALTGEYEVVNATQPLIIDVMPEDVDHALAFDPRNCAIAEACRRSGAIEAVIGASVAYVVRELDGRKVAVKYKVNLATRKAIDRFDVTGKMPARGFLLSKPRLSDTYKPGTKAKKPAYSRDTRAGDKVPTIKMELRNARGVIRLSRRVT